MKRYFLSFLLFVCIISNAHAQTHEGVDLGLPSGNIWARHNLGASSAEGFGEYYMFGSLIPLNHSFSEWSSSKSVSAEFYKQGLHNIEYGNYNEDIDSLKYSDRAEYIRDAIAYLELKPENDVVINKWGDGWSMPTLKDFLELIKFCKWSYSTIKGIEGYIITGKNGNSIFLPKTGSYPFDSGNKPSAVLYLSSTLMVMDNERFQPITLKGKYKDNGREDILISVKKELKHNAWTIRPVKHKND